LKKLIDFIKTVVLILLLQLSFSSSSYAVSCIDAPNSLAFEACSEARASGYSGSNSGFMSELGRAWDDGARRSSMELTEMKSRGELNWFENTIMFIFYVLFVGFVTAMPKSTIVKIVLGLVFFIPFAIRFWEYDYIMVVLVFMTSFGFISSYIEQDEEDNKKIKETLEEYEINWAKISPIRDIFAGRKADLIEYAKKNNVIVKNRDTVDEVLDKLEPLKQKKILANLSKADLIKYAKCGYYDSNKDAMVSGVMRADYDMSEEELREDRALIKTLTKAQIIEKIIQNKGRKVEKFTHQQTKPKVTVEELENERLESDVAMLSEYPKLKKYEIVEKLELCDSEFLDGLGLSYKKTDKKEVLLKKILTYRLNTTTKVRLIRLADKQGVSTKSRDTKAQIVEKILKNN